MRSKVAIDTRSRSRIRVAVSMYVTKSITCLISGPRERASPPLHKHNRPVVAPPRSVNTPHMKGPIPANPGPSSLSDIQKGRLIPGDSLSEPSKRPSWTNADVYNPAHIKELFSKHFFSFACAWHCSLTLGFSLPALLKPLVYTKQSSTPHTAFTRYVATAAHLSDWHNGDIFDPSTKAYASVQTVRAFHAAVRKNMTRDQPGTTWISSYDMACVQAGFFAAISLHPAKFGISGSDASDENLAKYIFFWRCVGRQLGVDDQFNLCGQDSATVKIILNEIINAVLLPDEANPPPEYNTMAGAYVGGLNLIFCGLPVISVASSLSFSFWAGGYPRTRWPAMTTCDWVRFYGLRIIMWCVGALPFVGTLLSWAARTSILQGSAAQLDHTDTKQKASNNVSKPLLREYAGSATCPVTGGIRKRHNHGGSLCTAGVVNPNALDPDLESLCKADTPSKCCLCCCRTGTPKSGPTTLGVTVCGLMLFLLLFVCLVVGSGTVASLHVYNNYVHRM
jgi:hypothetical protein